MIWAGGVVAMLCEFLGTEARQWQRDAAGGLRGAIVLQKHCYSGFLQYRDNNPRSYAEQSST